MGEHVEVGLLDLVEYGHAGQPDEGQLELEVVPKFAEQRAAALEQGARACHLETHQIADGRGQPQRFDVSLAHAEEVQILAGNVDVVAGGVGSHVLPVVGQLHGGRDLVGIANQLGVVVTEQSEKQPSHRLSRTCGVGAQRSKRRIARDLEIGAKCRQQILKGRQGQTALVDGVA